MRVNDDDIRYIWFQSPDDGTWHRLEWEHAPMLGTPFSDEAARYARILARHTDRFTDPATALAEVLARWNAGEVLDRRERRMAARLSAERAGLATAAEMELTADPIPALPAAASSPLVVGDDDNDDELFDHADDLDGVDVTEFYSDALEVLE